MKLIEIVGKEKALSSEDLIESIKDGVFTKDGSHLIVLRNFNIASYGLTSLIGSPQKVKGGFSCYDNKLTSLEGCPQEVGENFSCEDNQLTSLEGCPQIIGTIFSCTRNKLTSLKNIHKYLKKMDGTLALNGNPIKSCVLGLLKIQGCSNVVLDNKKAQEILNRYLAGSRDLLDCQEELIEAGFEEFAQL